MVFICAVCQSPCRGQCTRCGAHVCVTHKPNRSGCSICRQKRPASTPNPARSFSAPHALPFASLPVPEQAQQLASLRAQLVQKQARERAYLDRRAARGTHTPTDDAYEADQLLEARLLDALDLLAAYLSDASPGSKGTLLS
jgi:hypothetical protein